MLESSFGGHYLSIQYNIRRQEVIGKLDFKDVVSHER